MTVNERMRILRRNLKISQTEFGDTIYLSQNHLSQLENGDRTVTDRTIKLICQTFNVNEEWLRYGRGEMFNETDSNMIDELSKEYNLDDIDIKIIECYLKLGPLQRKVIKDYARSVADAIVQVPDTNTAAIEAAATERSGQTQTTKPSGEEIAKQIDELKE